MYFRFCFSFVRGLLDIVAAVTSIVLGVCLVGIVAAAAGVVRLEAANPFLEGELETAIGTPVSIDGATLRWNASLRRFALRVEGVSIADPDGRPTLYAPTVYAGFDWRALSRGRTVIKGVSMSGLRLIISKDAVGGLSVGAPRAESAVPVSDVLARLQERAAGPGLEEILLTEAAVLVRGPDGALVRLAEDIDAVMQITPEALILSLEGAAPGRRDGRLAFDGVFSAAERRFDARARIENAEADRLLSAFFGAPPGTSGVVEASVHAFNEDGGATQGDFEASVRDIGFGEGAPLLDEALFEGGFTGRPARIDFERIAARAPGGRFVEAGGDIIQTPEGFEITLAGRGLDVRDFSADAPIIEEADLSLFWEPRADELRLRYGRLQSGDALMTGFGALRFVPGLTPQLSVHAELEGALPHRDLVALWPATVASGTRSWLDGQVTAGDLTGARLEIDAAAGELEQDLVSAGALDLTFSFRDASVIATDELPPITDITGAGSVRGTVLDLAAPSARMGGAVVRDVRVSAPRVDDETTYLTVTGSATSTAADAVRVFTEYDPNAPEIDFDLDELQGAVEADFSFARPMVEFVAEDDIRVKAAALVRDVTAPRALGSAPLTKGHMALRIVDRRAWLQGGGEVLGVPVSVKWGGSVEIDGPSDFRIGFRIDPSVLDTIGMRSRAAFEGAAAVIIEGVGDGVTLERAELVADFTRARLQAPQFGFVKAWGDPAIGRMRMTLSEDGIVVEDLDLTSEAARIHGDMVFGPEGELISLDLPKVFADGIVDAALTANARADGVIEASLTGPFFDLRPVLESLDDLARLEGFEQAGEAAAAPGAPSGFAVTARLDTVRLHGDELWRGLIAHGVIEGMDLQRFSFTADDRRGEAVVGRYDAAARTVLVRAENAGRFFHGLFDTTSIEGGAFDASVTLEEGGGADGFVRVQDFLVRDAPLAARVLSAGSLEGLVNLLNGEGIAFDKLEAPFRFEDGVFTLKRAAAEGSSVGVSLRGSVDTQTGGVDLKGAVAPFYRLNSVFSPVPVLGDILTSRRGEGVLGIVFALQGDASELDLVINPLSIAAPGILRRFFEWPLDAEDTLRAADGVLPKPTLSNN